MSLTDWTGELETLSYDDILWAVDDVTDSLIFVSGLISVVPNVTVFASILKTVDCLDDAGTSALCSAGEPVDGLGDETPFSACTFEFLCSAFVS